MIEKLNRIRKTKKSILENSRIIAFRINKIVYPFKYMRKSQYNVGSDISESKFYIDENLLEDKNEIITYSEQIINGNLYDISGNMIKIDDDIIWNKDYINDFVWENKKFNKYVLKDPNTRTDIKNIWELSRGYHILTVAKAYLMTKDDKYAEYVIKSIKNWIENNKFNYGVNWTVSMEVAIRASNFIEALIIIKKYRGITDVDKRIINESLYQHGIYITNNLEKGFITNNHYISNLVGLIYIGIYFRGIKNKKLNQVGNKWIKFSIKQLLIELEYQVKEDGFIYEDSISYHCLTTEMVMICRKILEKNNIEVDEALELKLDKMMVALNNVLIDGQHIPIIGDLDNGRYLPLDTCYYEDKCMFSYLKNEYINNWDNKKYILDICKYNFDDIGLYRLNKGKFDILVRCGRIGTFGLGAHAHNDQLSILLWHNKKEIFIDSGTGIYSGDYNLRKQLRSTESHNTITIEGEEQNNIDKLFGMIEKTNSNLIDYNQGRFEGEHRGFKEAYDVVCKRKVKCIENSVIIEDTVDKTISGKNVYVNYIISNKLNIVKRGQKIIIISNGNEILILEFSSDYIQVDTNHKISNSYGSIMETTKIRVKMSENKLVTTISEIN